MEKSKTYKFADDGSQLVAESAMQIVSHMRDSSKFASNQIVTEYMRDFSARYYIDSGNRIRHNTTENFVADLLKFGFLEEL